MSLSSFIKPNGNPLLLLHCNPRLACRRTDQLVLNNDSLLGWIATLSAVQELAAERGDHREPRRLSHEALRNIQEKGGILAAFEGGALGPDEVGLLLRCPEQLLELHKALAYAGFHSGAYTDRSQFRMVWLATAALIVVAIGVSLLQGHQARAELVLIRTRLGRLEQDLAQVRVLLEQSGLKDAVQMPRQPLGPSGRGAILVQLAVDARFVRRVTCRLLGREHVLYRGDSPAAQRDIRAIAETIPVPLNAGEFRAVVEVEPFPAYGRDFGMFFSPERTRRERLFLSTPYGVFADPAPGDAARVADLLTIEPAADAAHPTRYVVGGMMHRGGRNRYGWLLIDPMDPPGGPLFVGSSLLLDADDPEYRARCYLGNRVDQSGFRIFVVVSDDPAALRDGQQIDRSFDWDAHHFEVSPPRFKVNDGQAGFSRDPESAR